MRSQGRRVRVWTDLAAISACALLCAAGLAIGAPSLTEASAAFALIPVIARARQALAGPREPALRGRAQDRHRVRLGAVWESLARANPWPWSI
jgi:hypothetical protein